MRVKGYLVIDSSGGLEVRKNPPNLGGRQIAVCLNLDVPDEFFRRPLPVVNIEIPKEAVYQPDVESVVATTAYKVAEALGLEVGSVKDGLMDLMAEKEAEQQ